MKNKKYLTWGGGGRAWGLGREKDSSVPCAHVSPILKMQTDYRVNAGKQPQICQRLLLLFARCPRDGMESLGTSLEDIPKWIVWASKKLVWQLPSKTSAVLLHITGSRLGEFTKAPRRKSLLGLCEWRNPPPFPPPKKQLKENGWNVTGGSSSSVAVIANYS